MALALALLLLLLSGAAAPVGAGPARESIPPLQAGSIVTLLGTRPELWVADGAGELHFVGDTRALAGRPALWNFRLQVSLETLQGLELGDPWLSTPLVTAGGAIFQPRWDSQAPTPTLYQVLAVGDLDLFGVDAENYGEVVLPQGEWERRTGFRLSDLPRQALPPLTALPAPAPAPPAAPVTSPAPAPGPVPTAAPPVSPGGQVRFTVPPGRDWVDVSSSLATLTRLVPSGTLQGERPLGVWQRSTGDGPYAYLQAIAIELAPHPEVTDVASLTDLKTRFLRNDSDAFVAGPAQPTTVGGQPALWFESEATRRFPGGDSSRGSVSAADVERYVTRQAPGRPVTELIWYARDVLTIQGGRGYAFRLFAAGPGVRSEHVRDLEQLLASVTFGD